MFKLYKFKNSFAWALSIFFILFAMKANAGALKGTYTIDSNKATSATNFKNFTNAVDSLTANGVSGPVVFNVASGIYNEALTIGTITGASDTNSILFQSASHDSSTVLLENTVNTVLTLNGCSNVNFKSITIGDSGSSGNDVVYFTGGATFDSLSNCVVTANLNDVGIGISGMVDYITVNNCLVTGGEIGILVFGGKQISNILIINNIMENFGYYAVEALYTDSIVITKNIITGSASSYNGIVMEDPYGPFTISKNKIIFPGGNNAAIYYVAGGSISSSDTAYIYDNFISMIGGSTQCFGISTFEAENTAIVFNNIDITSVDTTSAGIYDYDALGSVIYENNISVNTGGGYAVYEESPSSSGSFNYNDYYTTGLYLGWWGANEAKLSNWQAASGQDANSKSVNPLYNSATDLHPRSDSLYHTGTPIVGVADDIDGNKRNILTPDIGAVEFTPNNYDAGVVAIDSPSAGFCPGKNSIYATIENFGIKTLTSATISWVVMGGSSGSYSWTGSLVQGQTAQVNLGGSLTFSSGTIYKVKMYTSLPDGHTDGYPANDTMAVSVGNGLSGIFTIGGTSPDYATFSDAVKDVTAKGLCGSVVFNIRPGTYKESFTINPIANASPLKTLTFQSAGADSSTVLLTSGNSLSTVAFNGAAYVNFKNITISNSKDTGTVYFENIASHDSLSHCIIRSTSTGSETVDFNGYNTFITINNCALHGGNQGVFYNGNFDNGASGILITGNIIDSFSSEGIYLYYPDSFVISKNLVTNPANGNTYGIYVEFPTRAFYIYGNKIIFPESANGGGIYYYDGQYLDSTSQNMIYNNFISMGKGTGPVFGYDADNAASYTNFYYNSINIINTNASSTGIYNNPTFGGTGLKYIDNIAVNTGGGFAISVVNGNNIDSSDYNDFYTSGPYLGNYGFTGEATLSDWQTVFSMDANSISVNPYFISSTDLHDKNAKMWKTGTPIIGFTKDIDGKTRNSTHPTIGAAEIFPAANSLGISPVPILAYGECGDSNIIISVVLTNYGTINQKDIQVYTVISGAASLTLIDTILSINTGGSDTITYKTKLNTYNGGAFKITAYAKDTFKNNDTMSESVFFNKQSPSPKVQNNSSCHAGSVALYATPAAGDSIYWYSFQSGFPITSGDTFNTPFLSATTTYYAQESTRRHNYLFGPDSLSIGSYTGTSSAGIVFNVSVPIIIDSITVYPSGSGNVGVTLYDSSGTPITTVYSSVSVLYAYTAVRIPVGIAVNPGNGYSLKLDSSTTGGFYYNTSGASYPYKIANVISITNTSTNQGGSGYYYGAYDLLIHTGSCPSAFVAVTATIGGLSASLNQGASSSGKFRSGTLSNPDLNCAGSTFIYDLGTSFSNSGYGTTWDISAYSLTTSSGLSAGANFTFTAPTSSTAGMFTFAAQSSEIDSTFILSVNVKDLVKGCDTVVTRYINVSGLPKISVSPVSACAGVNETYSDTTVTNNSTLTWNFGDGSSIVSGINPAHRYAAKGTYTLKLIVTNASGCVDSSSVTININALPAANAGNNTSLCFGDSVSIGESALSGNTYSWTSNPVGFSSTLSNPSIVPAVTTTYYFTETKTVEGCSNSDSVVIIVNPRPIIKTASSTTICAGESASVGTAIIVTGDSYSWTSNPIGFNSTLPNQAVSPAVTTTYYIIESINATGCSQMDSQIVKVNPLPDAHWSAVVSNYDVTFTPKDTSAKSYRWQFGNGDSSLIQNPVYTYKADSVYTVSLTVKNTSGCTAQYDSNIIINTTTGIPTKLGTAVFNLKVSPNPFTSNLSITYTLPENQNVQLTVTDITGKQIANLVDENQTPGQHFYNIDAEKYNIPAGMYFLRMVAGDEVAEEKIVRIR